MQNLTLRNKFSLEQKASLPDGAGGWDETWELLCNHWCAIYPSSGKEVYSGSRQAQKITHRLVVRCSPFNSLIRPRANQRFRTNNRLFSILAVFERDNYGRYLTCLCEEVALL